LYKVSKFENAKAPLLKEIISLDNVLSIIKNGDDNLPLIKTARVYGKGNSLYDDIKTKLLPTFRFNFLFKGKANNQNIISSTGLIYLDVDEVDSIPFSDYILASWKSLSYTGFGVLVKVDNLTIYNYSKVYNQVSKILGINTDAGARKATQQTILSYDSNLYHNPNSLVFHFSENKKVSNDTILEKERECIGRDDTFIGITSEAIRFSNTNDYFTGEYKDEVYRIFDEKIKICSPFIRLRTEVGKRNSTMFYLLSQYALLNQNAGKPFLKAISDTINKKMYPSLSNNEINLIIDSVIKKRDDNTLTMFYNEERKILFNPNIQLSRDEKMNIVNVELGKQKSQLTKETIYIVLENWNFEEQGKITQKKIVELSSKSIATVKRYWNEFKDYVIDLNNDYKVTKSIASKNDSVRKAEEKE
jgi:hypothetical protein